MIKEASARDLMKGPVKRIWMDTPVREAAGFLLRQKISGVLVVDVKGRPVGVFTLRDMAEHVRRQLLELPEVDPAEVKARETGERLSLKSGFHVETLDETPVSGLMTPHVVTVQPSTPMRTLARLMNSKGFHRVFVKEAGQIIGVITSMDILEWVGKARAAEPRKVSL